MEGTRTTKRYVLLTAESALSQDDLKALAGLVESRYGRPKLIPVIGRPEAVIIKTDNLTAPALREAASGFAVGGKRLTAVLTSGAVGKLKKRAGAGKDNGQVPER